MSSKDDGKQEQKPSRVIVDFEGPGLANVAAFRFVNVTPGQVLVLAEWARAQADVVLAGWMNQQRREPPPPQIIVPRIVSPPPS